MRSGKSIIPIAGKPDRNQPKERRKRMGLFKRKNVWWMSITYQGKQIRRSTGTSDKRLAEAVLGKVKVKIIEGKYFDTLEEKDRTFSEMMERYMKEQAHRKALSSHIREHGCLGHLLP